MRTSHRLSAALVGVIALFAASCGSGTAETTANTTASDEPAPLAESSTGTEESAVQTVSGPLFETVSGGQFDLGSVEGTDTVLWFWAPW